MKLLELLGLGAVAHRATVDPLGCELRPPAELRSFEGQLDDVLLLDFGGVCLVNPVELHSYAESKLGLTPGTLSWMGPLDPSSDDLWQRMIGGGDVIDRDYWRIRAEEVGRLVGREMDVRQYMELIYNPPRPELIRTACNHVVDRAKKKGLAVSVFTKDLSAFHGPDWAAEIDLLKRVDHLVDCAET